jgi:SAM-dependent methyltransferase
VHAYEPSKTRGREENPPFTLVHTIAELGLRKFDVINLEQVLEHTRSPMATLQTLHSLCRPGAIVRIAVPNILRSAEGKHLWSDWPFDGRRPHTLAPFEHLHGFTPESLKRLVKRAGFSQVRWSRLIFTHPQLAFRRVVGQLWLPFDQTLVIAQSLLSR